MTHNQNRRRRLCSVIAVVTTALMAGNARGANVAQDDARHSSRNHHGHYTVGYSVQTLNVPGTLGESRPVNVHLWYPARRVDDCNDSSESGRSRGYQGCALTPSMYSSRLYGVPLLPQWDPLLWTIGSSESFDNLPLTRGHHAFPVILFSHGNQNNATPELISSTHRPRSRSLTASTVSLLRVPEARAFEKASPIGCTTSARSSMPCLPGLASTRTSHE